MARGAAQGRRKRQRTATDLVHPVRRIQSELAAALSFSQAEQEAPDVLARCGARNSGECCEDAQRARIERQECGKRAVVPSGSINGDGGGRGEKAPWKKQRLMRGLSPAFKTDMTQSQSSRMPCSASQERLGRRKAS